MEAIEPRIAYTDAPYLPDVNYQASNALTNDVCDSTHTQYVVGNAGIGGFIIDVGSQLTFTKFYIRNSHNSNSNDRYSMI